MKRLIDTVIDLNYEFQNTINAKPFIHLDSAKDGMALVSAVARYDGGALEALAGVKASRCIVPKGFELEVGALAGVTISWPEGRSNLHGGSFYDINHATNGAGEELEVARLRNELAATRASLYYWRRKALEGESAAK